MNRESNFGEPGDVRMPQEMVLYAASFFKDTVNNLRHNDNDRRNNIAAQIGYIAAVMAFSRLNKVGNRSLKMMSNETNLGLKKLIEITRNEVMHDIRKIRVNPIALLQCTATIGAFTLCGIKNGIRLQEALAKTMEEHKNSTLQTKASIQNIIDLHVDTEIKEMNLTEEENKYVKSLFKMLLDSALSNIKHIMHGMSHQLIEIVRDCFQSTITVFHNLKFNPKIAPPALTTARNPTADPNKESVLNDFMYGMAYAFPELKNISKHNASSPE